MRVLGRVLLILFTFVVTGYVTLHWLVARAAARGVPEVDVRMGAALGGLFAGGVAACVVGLLSLMLGSKPEKPD